MKVNTVMSENKYEALRNDIINTITELCVKTSNDGMRHSYKWSFGEVANDVARLAGISDGKLPDDLKTIVRFEFNKLKDKVMTLDGWTDKTSRISPAITQDGIELRRTNVSTFDNLSLNDKLKGARHLLDAAGKALAKADTSEKSASARKRINRLNKEILYLNNEIAQQDKLKLEIAAQLALDEANKMKEAELAANVANGQHEGEQ